MTKEQMIKKYGVELKEGKNVIMLKRNGKNVKKVITYNSKPSLTDQQYKDDVDASNIVKKFKKTGQITHLAKKAGSYADCSQIDDLHSSLIKVKEAEQALWTFQQKQENSLTMMSKKWLHTCATATT